MSDDAQTLINAIGDWKLRLETRDMMEPKRAVDNQGIVRTEMEFKTQLLQFPRAVVEETTMPLSKKKACQQTGSIIFNAVAGVDFGVGTARPLQVTKAAFLKALDQFSNVVIGSISGAPVSPHPFTVDVTPQPATCPFALAVHLDGSTGSPSSPIMRATCFSYSASFTNSSSFSGSYFDAGCHDDGIQTRNYDYGASGIVTEAVDFGDAVSDQADFASTTHFWVAYSFSASSEWTCSFGPCSDGSGGGGSFSGPVCPNFLALGDTFSGAPAGATGSSPVVVSGSGWSANSNSLAVYFQDPAMGVGCLGTFNVTY